MKLPKIVGDYAKGVYRHVREILVHTRLPVCLVGPTGTAKTLIMLHALRWYSEKYGVPSYYLQMSPDVTRTTLVGGFRLVNGNFIPVKGVIMRAMEEGGIVGLDEFTHAEQEDQVSLNSALATDSLKLVSVGEIEAHAKPTTRFILAHNPEVYAGNKFIPQALRRRLYTIRVDFPPYEDEVKITCVLVKREYGVKIPVYWHRWAVSAMRLVRDEIEFPVSVSNIAAGLMGIWLLARFFGHKFNRESDLSGYSESSLVSVYEKIHGKLPERVSDIYVDKDVRRFFGDCEVLTSQKIIERLMNACMGPYVSSAVWQKIVALFPQVQNEVQDA